MKGELILCRTMMKKPEQCFVALLLDEKVKVNNNFTDPRGFDSWSRMLKTGASPFPHHKYWSYIYQSIKTQASNTLRGRDKYRVGAPKEIFPQPLLLEQTMPSCDDKDHFVLLDVRGPNLLLRVDQGFYPPTTEKWTVFVGKLQMWPIALFSVTFRYDG